MKLFETKKVKKFFEILYRLERGIPIDIDNYRYKNYKNDRSVCEKEVFVNRTVNKWLKGKFLVLYKTSEQTGLEYKQFISITNITLSLDWTSGSLEVIYMDYTRPVDIWNELVLKHNDVLHLEGEWSKNNKQHNQLLKLTYLNIPEKEYVFKTYNFDNHPKRKKKGQTDDDIMKLIEGKISFKGKTEKEAYNKKNKFQENNKTKLVICPDIIDIKS